MFNLSLVALTANAEADVLAKQEKFHAANLDTSIVPNHLYQLTMAKTHCATHWL